MKKTPLLFISLFLFFSFFSCKKGSGNNPTISYYFRGTVYLNNIPTPDITVKLGIRDSSKFIGGLDWDENRETKTDSDGKYEFKITETHAEPHGWTWKVRALNPGTGEWTDWIYGGTVTAGKNGAGTLDIYM